jgi:hypothetical protein
VYLGDLQHSVRIDQAGEDNKGKVRASSRQTARIAVAAKKVVAVVVEEASLAFWITTRNRLFVCLFVCFNQAIHGDRMSRP